MKRRAFALAAAVLAMGGILLSAAPTQAATQSATATLKLNGAVRTLPTDIVQKIKAGLPETLTPAERAILVATVPPKSGAAPTVVRGAPLSPTSGIIPFDIERCSGLVCVDVRSQNGHGNYITQWNSVWDLAMNVYDCTVAWNFWANYSWYETSIESCGEGAAYAYWYPNEQFFTGNAKTYWVGTLLGNSPSVLFQIKL